MKNMTKLGYHTTCCTVLTPTEIIIMGPILYLCKNWITALITPTTNLLHQYNVNNSCDTLKQVCVVISIRSDLLFSVTPIKLVLMQGSMVCKINQPW